MENIISLFLCKYSPRAFTITELSEGINNDLSIITPIRLYDKPISNILNSNRAPIYIVKTEVFGQEDKYSVNDLGKVNLRELKSKFQAKIIYLEELGYILANIMLDTNLGIQVSSFQQQIADIIKIDIERDDLNILLHKTFKGFVYYNRSNLTFGLIYKKNPIIDRLDLNQVIRNGIDAGISEVELLISNRLINSEAIRRVKSGANIFFDTIDEKIIKNHSKEETNNQELFNQKGSDELQTPTIDELIEKYKIAINQWSLVLNNTALNLDQRKKTILTFIADKEIAKEAIQVWFSENHNLLNKYRNVLGEELYLEIYTYLEKFKHKSSETDKEIKDEIIETNTNEGVLDSGYIINYKTEYPILFELLPKSLFYAQIPTKQELKTRISNYEMKLEHAAIEIGLNTKEIKKAIICIKNDLEDNNDWELIYKCINYDFDKLSPILTEAAKMLKIFAENPFGHFLSIIESTRENINFEENPRFNQILTEVCRDNFVTEAERELVFEKAAKFGGINLDKLELYLNNEFRNYPSFIVLIEEICEDGIVTDKELKFIEEKANTYRIPPTILSQLIATSLFKIKVFDSLKSNDDFKEIVIILLLSKAFKIGDDFSFSFNNYLSEIKDLEVDYSESLKIHKKIFLDKLLKYFNKLIELDIFDKDSNLFDLLNESNLSFIDFNFNGVQNKANRNFENSEVNLFGNKKMISAFNHETLLINNSIYNLIRKNMPIHPLFFYEYNKFKMQNEVIINIGHPMYKPELDVLIKQIACSLIHTKNTMTSREAEIFFNRFHQNLNLLQ